MVVNSSGCIRSSGDTYGLDVLDDEEGKGKDEIDGVSSNEVITDIGGRQCNAAPSWFIVEAGGGNGSFIFESIN